MTANEDDHGWFGMEWDAHGPVGAGRDEWDDWELDDDGPDDDLPPGPNEPLRGTDDALALLLGLVGPERAGPPALWFVLVDAQGYTLPVVLPIVDVPDRADPLVVHRLFEVLASVLAEDGPGGSVLIGLVRAAGGDRGAFESSWADALREGADAVGLRIWATAAIGEDRARVLEW